MPKLLVLFQSRRPDVVRLAETVAEGARSVRFAEVDLRRFADRRRRKRRDGRSLAGARIARSSTRTTSERTTG